MKDCYGEEKYQNGSVYIGEYKKNMKNGNGNLILGGQKLWVHWEIQNDKISGKGKFKFSFS